MDRSRYKRPGTQTPRQNTTKNTFGNDQPVPRGVYLRPQNKLFITKKPSSTPASAILKAAGAQLIDDFSHTDHKTLPNVSSPDLANQSTQKPVQTAAPSSALLARRRPMDMNLPGDASSSRLTDFFKKTKWHRVNRFATRGLAVAIIVVVMFGGFIFSQSYLKLHQVFRGGTGTAAALKPNVNPDLLNGEGSGRVNILLLGRGGGSHEGPDLTDSMMVLSIDPINHQATLLSIPRDLWVSVPGSGAMKINAAWETGEFQYLHSVTPGSTNPNAIAAGFTLVDKTVNQVLGININYNMLVNFQAFQQAVDSLGGVTVDVPSDLVDPTMAWQNGGNPLLAKAGVDNFNGQQALLYVRSRETSSDFARAQRQRAVLEAIETKALSLGTLSDPLKISNLVDAFGDNVATDISLSNAEKLYGLIKNLNNSKTNSIDLDSSQNPYVTTGNLYGQSIVLPATGLFNYSAIQTYVRTQLKDPYIVKENAKIFIYNGTSTPGLATNMQTTLKLYGYNVTGIANAPTDNYKGTQLINVSGGNPYTQHYLEERLHVKAKTALPNNSIPTNGANFVIIIGSNEANSSQNQTN